MKRFFRSLALLPALILLAAGCSETNPGATEPTAGTAPTPETLTPPVTEPGQTLPPVSPEDIQTDTTLHPFINPNFPRTPVPEGADDREAYPI